MPSIGDPWGNDLDLGGNENDLDLVKVSDFELVGRGSVTVTLVGWVNDSVMWVGGTRPGGTMTLGEITLTLGAEGV